MTTREQIKKAGQKLAKLNPQSTALVIARKWWIAGNVYSNADFDVLQGLESAIERYNMGYSQGCKCNPPQSEDADYDCGWDAGNCDRPTLDEATPLDVAKERSSGCLV